LAAYAGGWRIAAIGFNFQFPPRRLSATVLVMSPLAQAGLISPRNLQIGDGSLIITGLFGLVKRFCGIIQSTTSIYEGLVRDCLRANANSKGEA
jgi:hypothetical protein